LIRRTHNTANQPQIMIARTVRARFIPASF
jgi:hypothetical protein